MKTILVIDAHEPDRQFAANILRTHQFEVLEAADGPTGIQLAQQRPPDVIICELDVPELNGYDLLTTLHSTSTTATIPVIFLTHRADLAQMRCAMSQGADDYVFKPVSEEDLLGAINGRLKKQQILARHTEKQMDDLRRKITHALPHELRTPLHVVLGYSDLLVGNYGGMDADSLSMVKEISVHADRLHKLVEKFWAYADTEMTVSDANRVEALKDSQIVMSGSVIRDIAAKIAKKSDREKDLVLAVIDTPIRIAYEHLQRIVQELVDNGFKFSEPGTPVCVIALAKNEIFNLYVIDNGRGMSQEQIARIGAYMQFERELHEQQGIGLGLALVKRLTDLYGGRFKIDSVAGHETTVTISLYL